MFKKADLSIYWTDCLVHYKYMGKHSDGERMVIGGKECTTRILDQADLPNMESPLGDTPY